MYLRYAHAPPPKKEERATLWYRMSNRILHLWNNRERLKGTIPDDAGLQAQALHPDRNRSFVKSTPIRTHSRAPFQTRHPVLQ